MPGIRAQYNMARSKVRLIKVQQLESRRVGRGVGDISVTILEQAMSGELKISDYMTKTPNSIEPHQTISEARKRMKKLGCEHLPVLSGGQIVGIISDRDILFVCGRQSEEDSEIWVGDVMITQVIKLDVSTSLNEVVNTMLANKIGSVLLTKSGKLEGIFTETDALGLLAELTVGAKKLAA